MTHDPIITAARIRAERKRLKLTQRKAADLCGLSYAGYRRLEETATPMLDTLIELVSVGMRLEAISPELFQKRSNDRIPRQLSGNSG